jgi:hypothetical protein
MTPQQTLQKIAEKAKVLSIPDNLGLAKEFILIGDKMSELDNKLSDIINKEDKVDLTGIESQLKNIEEKLNEPTEVELIIE